jgi:glycerate-2-kinase
MALAALSFVRSDELLLPFSSDGRDNSDHAGGIADAVTLENAETHHISSEEYLADHRSYDFFTTTNDALLVGYTESNVSDLIIAIKK